MQKNVITVIISCFFFCAKSGLHCMVSCASPGVVGVDFVDIEEVFRQVHGYFGRESDLVDQPHCKVLYSVIHPKPPKSVEVCRGEVGSGSEAK